MGSMVIALIAVGLLAAVALAYNPLGPNETAPKADFVFGQPNFTSTAAGSGLSQFNVSLDVAFDSNSVMFVADRANNRILVFIDQSDTVADTAVGAASGTSADLLQNPYYLAVWDGSETSLLFVADRGNNRVLGYITRCTAFSNGFFPDTTADYVFGQASFTTSAGATTANSLNSPMGLAVLDTGGDTFSLFVSDRFNRRVLRYDLTKKLIGCAYNAIDTTADAVWGQADFTSSATGCANNLLSTTLEGLAVATDRLFICDNGNNRLVLESLVDGDTLFDGVYGQKDLNSSAAGIDTFGLSSLRAAALSASRGLLAIADPTNDRVVIHTDTTGTDTAADYVIGDTDFIASPHGQTSDTLINFPWGVAWLANRALFVSSELENRVLRFDDQTYAAGSQIQSGDCLITRHGAPDRLLSCLRGLRDSVLETRAGRVLVSVYYFLGT